MTTPNRLTSEQRSAIYTDVVLGYTLEDFLARKPDWPQDLVTEWWNRLAAVIRGTTLKPGQYWGIPSEWP